MAARPICFMIMPYSTKPTLQPPDSKAPSKINFDSLWNKAIKPAIDAIGYDPVRADQDLGALIIQEMIERLAISDLVVADVTIANGNVYYEVGIRHAARQQGCVMMAADWAKPLFDIDQMRQIRYPLPAEDVSDDTAAAIQEILKEGIPPLAEGDSPVYLTLPGYPGNIDVNRASSFRDSLKKLNAFQTEVSAAKSATGAECKRRALELRNQYFAGGPIQKAVALELFYMLRDCTDWPTTLQFISQLPEDIRKLPVIQEQTALAQSKDGDHPTAIGGLRELIKVAGDSAERRGLLGGRYKKLYTSEANPALKANYLNQAIGEYENGMKLDLNDYYPSSNLPRLYRKRGRKGDDDRARVAAAIAMVACERAMKLRPDDEWLRPTLLGAAFDAGDVEKARDLAGQVMTEGPASWKLETTLADLNLAITFQDSGRAQELAEIEAGLEALLAAKQT